MASGRATDLYRQTRRAAWAGLIVTLSLGCAKLACGWAGHSFALVSDSVHSFGDAVASAAILLALRWAERPADAEHPYGHARIETVAASNVALLLVGSGIWIVAETVRGWGEPSPPPDWYTLVIAAAGVGLNEAMFRYSIAVARRTESKAVAASAWDQRLDVFGSLVVLVGLAVGTWAGPGWAAADKVAALAVAGIILWAGAALFWGSVHDLIDRQAEPGLVSQVRQVATSVPGVRGVEKLFVRKAGLEHLVDIHVEVDANMSVRDGHAIGHAVKDRVMGEVPTVRSVLVHVEPVTAGVGECIP